MFKFMSHEPQHECAGPRSYVKTRRVDECRTMDELFLHCLPAFGGAYLRRIYQILDTRHRHGLPAHPGRLRPGHGLRPASYVADSAARNRLGGLPQHHRRRLLSRRSSQPRRLQIRPHPRSPHQQRRRRPARRGHHPRHRHGLRRRRAAGPGPFPLRGSRPPGIPAQDDRHRTALPAGKILRRAGRTERRARRDCSPPASAAPYRSSSARPATAASS